MFIFVSAEACAPQGSRHTPDASSMSSDREAGYCRSSASSVRPWRSVHSRQPLADRPSTIEAAPLGELNGWSFAKTHCPLSFSCSTPSSIKRWRRGGSVSRTDGTMVCATVDPAKTTKPSSVYAPVAVAPRPEQCSRCSCVSAAGGERVEDGNAEHRQERAHGAEVVAQLGLHRLGDVRLCRNRSVLQAEAVGVASLAQAVVLQVASMRLREAHRFGRDRHGRLPEVFAAMVLLQTCVAVLGLADVRDGRARRGRSSPRTGSKRLHAAPRRGRRRLQRLARNLDGLHGAAGDFRDAHASGVAIGQKDLDGFGRAEAMDTSAGKEGDVCKGFKIPTGNDTRNAEMPIRRMRQSLSTAGRGSPTTNRRQPRSRGRRGGDADVLRAVLEELHAVERVVPVIEDGQLAVEARVAVLNVLKRRPDVFVRQSDLGVADIEQKVVGS